jgi:hypothetical protein
MSEGSWQTDSGCCFALSGVWPVFEERGDVILKVYGHCTEFCGRLSASDADFSLKNSARAPN